MIITKPSSVVNLLNHGVKIHEDLIMMFVGKSILINFSINISKISDICERGMTEGKDKISTASKTRLSHSEAFISRSNY